MSRFSLLFCLPALWAAPVPSLKLKTVEAPAVRRTLARPARVAEFWLGPLSAAERVPAAMKPGLTRAGVHRMGGRELLARGQWSELPDGRAVFQAALRSPGAKGLRLEVLGLPRGTGRLWLYPGDEANPVQPVGPYEGGEDFWTALVEGESLVLEFEAPAGAPRMLPFQVGRISHLFASLVPAKGGTGEAKLGPLSPGRETALGCNLDVTCYPEWDERARGVGRYLFETDGGGAFCSGSLINTRNSSGIPYFLTADHCVSTPAEARSVQVFWFYQSSICNGPPRNLRDVPTTLGATYLTSGALEAGDYSLLRLTGTVPNGLTLAGWTSTDPEVGAEVTGIHHPTGDYKRISFGNKAEPILARGRPEPMYHTITWRGGVTEGGSSGSPIFNRDGQIVGMLSGGPKPPAGKTECDLQPAYDWYGRFSVAYPALQSYLEERTTGTTPTPPPTGGTTGTLLASGVPANFTVGPVDSPTLLSGSSIYRVEVPAGATRLEVRLRTSTAGADLDLFLRRGSAPVLSGGRVVADTSSTTDSGDETIVITPSSAPALQPGTYFIGLALFTTETTVRGTLTAIVTGGTTTPPASAAVALTSGQTRTITLEPTASGTLLAGAAAYRIDVPAGATGLEIRLATDTANVDVDLYARFNAEAVVQNQQVVADHRSEGPAGSELITITPASSPALRAGTYFINLGVFTANTRITARLTATVTSGTVTPPVTTTRTLTSGAAVAFNLAPVDSPSLFSGEEAYQIAVPAGATRLEVRVRTTTPGADVDLYVRAGEAPRVSGGSVVADYSSEGDTGDETIVITPSDTPALRAGTYFIALGLFTRNVRVQGTVMATVTTGGASNTVAQPLIAGLPQRFRIAPVTTASLILDPSFRIAVPENASRVRVVLQTTTPGVDVDLYARLGQAPVVTDGRIATDYRSEGPAGEETISITASSTPPLRAGTLFISLGLFTPNAEVQGQVTVYVDTAAPPPAAAVQLTSGVAARFTLPATAEAELYAGTAGFRIQVPAGSTSLTVRLNTTTPNADVDLYVRRGADVELADGELIADYYAEGTTGNETIVITRSSQPPLEAGTYFIALGNFARNVQVTGVVTATVERAPAPPAAAQARTLVLNQPLNWSFPAVEGPTLLSDANAFRLDVTNVSRMEIVLSTGTPGADVDLYVRYGSPPEVREGRVVADFSSAGATGEERVTITPGANSPLRSGTYWVALGVFTPGVATAGRLEARDLSGGNAEAPKLRLRPRFGDKGSQGGLEKAEEQLLVKPVLKGKYGPMRAAAALSPDGAVRRRPR
ncbi:MAG: pre-peptidase C-terminal domain-containing protein [Acidobacteria bacterium]|nr:pre-peptidase C-terminal domain-containing protein [Bryobacteraceae bacterium CoA2 C42]